MMVCDVCWSPQIATSGQAMLRNVASGSNVFLFGQNVRESNSDLCAECIALFRARDWAGIAERAQNALIKRLEAS